MGDAFLDSIRLFTFIRGAPKDWVPCDGRLMNIAENQALFSLFGETFGGDGRTTFALPIMKDLVVGVHYCIARNLSKLRLEMRGQRPL